MVKRAKKRKIRLTGGYKACGNITTQTRTAYSNAAGPASEFIEIASRKDYADVLPILDELMDCIKALYPKSYSAVIRKLTEL